MQNPIKYDLDKLSDAIKKLPRRVAVVAENFSKERFREQGWKSTTVEPWKKRKHDKAKDTGRAILVKSGRLRRSIKARAVGFDITVSSDVPYAQAHNDGFSGDVSETVSSHSRKSHKRKSYTRSDGRVVDAVDVKAHQVGQFTRKRNFNLPQRQFIGQSASLDNEIIKVIEREISDVFK